MSVNVCGSSEMVERGQSVWTHQVLVFPSVWVSSGPLWLSFRHSHQQREPSFNQNFCGVTTELITRLICFLALL